MTMAEEPPTMNPDRNPPAPKTDTLFARSMNVSMGGVGGAFFSDQDEDTTSMHSYLTQERRTVLDSFRYTKKEKE